MRRGKFRRGRVALAAFPFWDICWFVYFAVIADEHLAKISRRDGRLLIHDQRSTTTGRPFGFSFATLTKVAHADRAGYARNLLDDLPLDESTPEQHHKHENHRADN